VSVLPAGCYASPTDSQQITIACKRFPWAASLSIVVVAPVRFTIAAEIHVVPLVKNRKRFSINT